VQTISIKCLTNSSDYFQALSNLLKPHLPLIVIHDSHDFNSAPAIIFCLLSQKVKKKWQLKKVANALNLLRVIVMGV
jgi:hypothetical protein